MTSTNSYTKDIFKGIYYPLTENARTVLRNRYVAKDSEGRPLESEDDVFKRVALAIAAAEKLEDREKWAKIFYEYMASGKFMPNSPALFNAGLDNGFSLSACHVLVPDDTLESIVEVMKNLALVQRAGGGVGYTFEKLRPRGSYISSTKSTVDGPIPFITSYCSVTDAIQQGSKRRGAQMGILTIDHPDVWDFIHHKTDMSQWQNMNVSVKITRDWFKSLREAPKSPCPVSHPKWGSGYLYHTDKGVKALRGEHSGYKKVTKEELFEEIVNLAHETGDPGVLFWDRVMEDCVFPADSERAIAATNPCLAPGTLILTSDGYVPIELLSQGTRVVQDNRVSYNGPEKDENNPEYWSVDPFQTDRQTVEVLWAGVTKKSAPVVAVKLRSGHRIVCTHDHHLATPKGMVEAKDLNSGDQVLLGRQEAVSYDKISKEDDRALGVFYGLYLSYDGEVWDHPDRKLVETAISTISEGDLEEPTFVVTRLEPAVKKKASHIEKYIRTYVLNRPAFLFGLLTACKPRTYKSLPIEDIIYGLSSLGIHFPIECEEDFARLLDNIELIETFIRTQGDVPAEYLCPTISEVESVTPAGITDVYCLKAEGNRTVIANGVVARRCGEIPLENYGSCTIGSINISKFVKNGIIDYSALAEAIKVGIRFLDDIVSVNKFPVEGIQEVNDSTRRIGLGPMGWADTLFKLGIPYDSQEALDLAETVSKFFRKVSLQATRELAEEKGVFPAIEESSINEPRRNAYVNMAAPTGTISILAGCSPSIEPLFSLAFERKVMRDAEGIPVRMIEINPVFEAALDEILEKYINDDKSRKSAKEGVINYVMKHGTLRGYNGSASKFPEWGRLVEVFVCAHDVPPTMHVRMQAAWQKHFDQAISKTISLPKEGTKADLKECILLAEKLGCKGITLYRDGSRDGKAGQIQPMALKNKEVKKPSTTKPPAVSSSIKVSQRSPLGNLHMFFTMSADKTKILEMFGVVSRPGEMPAADLDAICRLSSLLLQRGVDPREIYKQLKGLGSSTTFPTEDGKILSLPDGVAVALRKACRFINHSIEDRASPAQETYNLVCNNCNGRIVSAGGCVYCPSCGYSAC